MGAPMGLRLFASCAGRELVLVVPVMCIVALGGCASTLPRQTPAMPGGPPSGVNEELRRELLAMEEEDQKLRKQFQPDVPAPKLWEETTRVDARNTARMHEIVDQLGWPTRGLVGEDGATAAWLLVQHADLDVPFQQRCLDLMEAQLARGEVSAKDVAYLRDSVRTNEGKPQRYGTQLHSVDGAVVPLPIEDPEHVDERRANMGLPPLAEHLQQVQTY